MTDKMNPTEAMETNEATGEQQKSAGDSGGTAKKRKTHRLKQRFQVVRKLGQGTYGKVQLAINNETGQEVAIKTIKKSKVENDQDLVRIKREIQIMSSIHHPHITHIYEVFENKDKIVLVMQYASGGELYDYVSYKKALNDSEARRLFRQIATAIYYCHKNKICHRDLKLENILLDEKGNAKIADFGLSNVFDDRHFLQTFCGSPLYASPEIVRGMPYFGPEVDCWSLGVLLYTLVYGAMPFDGSNFKKLVKQISESKYFEPAEKSPATDLIRKLLLADAKERATIVDICNDEWVNQDYEHSLLQVAEDLSNLTPVRIDLLLSLAPTSPVEITAPEVGADKKEAQAGETNNESKRVVETPSQDNVPVTKKKKAKKDTKEEVKAKDEEKAAEDVPMPQPEEQLEATQTNVEVVHVGEETPKQEEPIVEKDVPASPKLPEPAEAVVPEETQASGKLEASSSKEISSPKRPGRLSIPKIWDTVAQDKDQSPPVGQDKKPFIPTSLKVAEAKKVLEQKASTKRDVSKRRESIATVSELDKGKRTRELKKYNTRSISLNLSTEAKAKAGETGDKKPAKTAVVEKQQQQDKPALEEEKSLAKQLLKKNIAKAQLMEKRQLSNSSTAESETTPIMAIEDSSVSIMQNIPIKAVPPPMVEPKRAEKLITTKESTELTPQPTNAAPIARSYKKVTFTKDGACITESGKVFTRESKDGTMTRIEKKSKVTHIITGDADRVNIQRSDSQSSSGSTDIFDDIFDDHWTDDVFSKSIFSTKSLFNEMFNRPRLGERTSLRTRAESLERGKNDLLFRRPNMRSDFFLKDKGDHDEDDAFGSDIFNRSRQFISNFDRLRIDDTINNIKREASATSSLFPSRFSRESSLNRDASFFSSSKKIFRDESSNQEEQFTSPFDRVKQCVRTTESSSDAFENNYGTIGPRNFRRYTKQINSTQSSSSFFDKFEKEMTGENSSTSSVNVVVNKMRSSTTTANEGQEESIPVIPRNSDIELNVSVSGQDCKNAIKIEEQSSLLEQLRKFGYKKLVDRRVSESGSSENLAEWSSVTSQSAQTGVFESSSQTKREEMEKSVDNVIHRFKQLDTDSSFEVTKGTPEVRQSTSEFQRISSFETSESGRGGGGNNESVEERIRRKSYFSRFNEDSRSARQRRRSITRYDLLGGSGSNNSSSSTLFTEGNTQPWTMMRSSSTSRPAYQSYTSLDSDRPVSVNRVSSRSFQVKESFHTYKGSRTSNSFVLNFSNDKNAAGGGGGDEDRAAGGGGGAGDNDTLKREDK